MRRGMALKEYYASKLSQLVLQFRIRSSPSKQADITLTESSVSLTCSNNRQTGHNQIIWQTNQLLLISSLCLTYHNMLLGR